LLSTKSRSGQELFPGVMYKGFISPLTLQRPARTFLSWYYENDKGTMFYQYLEVCQRLFTTISIASLCKNET
jgi:hypothetical protein